MIDEKQMAELKAWREDMPGADRQIAALEMIADQLAAIDGRLFQIQGILRVRK